MWGNILKLVDIFEKFRNVNVRVYSLGQIHFGNENFENGRNE